MHALAMKMHGIVCILRVKCLSLPPCAYTTRFAAALALNAWHCVCSRMLVIAHACAYTARSAALHYMVSTAWPACPQAVQRASSCHAVLLGLACSHTMALRFMIHPTQWYAFRTLSVLGPMPLAPQTLQP
ncbi:hypothetical protein JKP88DRAFT_222920, partial [Tribonema minus]